MLGVFGRACARQGNRQKLELQCQQLQVQPHHRRGNRTLLRDGGCAWGTCFNGEAANESLSRDMESQEVKLGRAEQMLDVWKRKASA
eukprot:2377824-Amphidinium_carterae.1